MDPRQEALRTKVTKLFFGMIIGLGGSIMSILGFTYFVRILITSGFTFGIAGAAVLTFAGMVVMTSLANRAEKRLKFYIPGFYTEEEKEKYRKWIL